MSAFVPNKGGNSGGQFFKPVSRDGYWEIREEVGELGQCNHFVEGYTPHRVEGQVVPSLKIRLQFCDQWIDV